MKNRCRLHGIFLLSVLTGSLLLFSCQKEENKYSTGDFMVSFGVVEKRVAAAESDLRIHLDNGDRFVSLSPSGNSTEFKTGQRVLVNFAPFEDRINSDKSKIIFGKINLIQDILFKNIVQLAQANKDSIGNDPVIVRESWISGDSILTVGYNYYREIAFHSVSLVNLTEGNGKEKPLIFEFRHNAKGDLPVYRSSGYVSFDLKAFRIEGQHKTNFILRSTDYQGKTSDVPYTFSY